MKIIYIDPERCLACKSCELACAVAHSRSKELLQAIAEEPRPAYRVSVIASQDIVLPLQCRHCEEAPCVEVCPSRALTKEKNGIVSLDAQLCIGCQFCLLVCPFGVIKTDKEGKAVIKCDLCRDRLERGEEPACVTACLTGALKFVEAEEVSRTKQDKFLTEYKKQMTKSE